MEKSVVSEVCFEVTSGGLSGEMWLKKLEETRCKVGKEVVAMFLGERFVPCPGRQYKLVVIFGREFKDEDRITSNVLAEALKRNYARPPLEACPLLREKICCGDMERLGVCLLLMMHEPCSDATGKAFFIGIADDKECLWLNAYESRADRRWYDVCGFVYLDES